MLTTLEESKLKYNHKMKRFLAFYKYKKYRLSTGILYFSKRRNVPYPITKQNYYDHEWKSYKSGQGGKNINVIHTPSTPPQYNLTHYLTSHLHLK